MNKQQLIQLCLENDFLLSPDFLEQDTENVEQTIIDALKKKMTSKEKPIVLNKDIYSSLKENNMPEINWLEFEKSRVLKEKRKNNKMYNAFLNFFQYSQDEKNKKKIDHLIKDIQQPHTTQESDISLEKTPQKNNVIILKNYEEESNKREIKDFVKYFRLRYDAISAFLKNRPELQNLISINHLQHKEARSDVALIGLVYEKYTTKTGDFILGLEDPTGHIRVYINKNSSAFAATENICYDEVLGVKGFYNNKSVTATNILFPDIINTKNKQTTTDVCVAFISDIHVGSKYFLEKEFTNFIQWINGNIGNEKQRKIAKHLQYIFVAGDVVDGIGVYPKQEDNLTIQDIKEQYNQLTTYLQGITRTDINIIMCPGQHDATRVSQPQPALHHDYTQTLHSLPFITFVSNPSLVNIHASQHFEGFNILLYHGASFHYYIDNFESLRKHHPRENPCVVHKFLLQKRHLSPSHTATVYTPESKEDHLIITTVPDVLVCGDMHRADTSTYNGIITINASCWQSKTDFQEKTGNNPNPGKVPILNLRTREVTMIDFCHDVS